LRENHTFYLITIVTLASRTTAPRHAPGDVGVGPHYLAACVFCIATIFHWFPCLKYVIVDRSTLIPEASLYVNTFFARENSTATDPKTRT
jgi:hypothetical protein